VPLLADALPSRTLSRKAVFLLVPGLPISMAEPLADTCVRGVTGSCGVQSPVKGAPVVPLFGIALALGASIQHALAIDVAVPPKVRSKRVTVRPTEPVFFTWPRRLPMPPLYVADAHTLICVTA
jgi:hypothetical protein